MNLRFGTFREYPVVRTAGSFHPAADTDKQHRSAVYTFVHYHDDSHIFCLIGALENAMVEDGALTKFQKLISGVTTETWQREARTDVLGSIHDCMTMAVEGHGLHSSKIHDHVDRALKKKHTYGDGNPAEAFIGHIGVSKTLGKGEKLDQAVQSLQLMSDIYHKAQENEDTLKSKINGGTREIANQILDTYYTLNDLQESKLLENCNDKTEQFQMEKDIKQTHDDLKQFAVLKAQYPTVLGSDPLYDRLVKVYISARANGLRNIYLDPKINPEDRQKTSVPAVQGHLEESSLIKSCIVDIQFQLDKYKKNYKKKYNKEPSTDSMRKHYLKLEKKIGTLLYQRTIEAYSKYNELVNETSNIAAKTNQKVGLGKETQQKLMQQVDVFDRLYSMSVAPFMKDVLGSCNDGFQSVFIKQLNLAYDEQLKLAPAMGSYMKNLQFSGKGGTLAGLTIKNATVMGATELAIKAKEGLSFVLGGLNELYYQAAKHNQKSKIFFDTNNYTNVRRGEPSGLTTDTYEHWVKHANEINQTAQSLTDLHRMIYPFCYMPRSVWNAYDASNKFRGPRDKDGKLQVPAWDADVHYLIDCAFSANDFAMTNLNRDSIIHNDHNYFGKYEPQDMYYLPRMVQKAVHMCLFSNAMQAVNDVTDNKATLAKNPNERADVVQTKAMLMLVADNLDVTVEEKQKFVQALLEQGFTNQQMIQIADFVNKYTEKKQNEDGTFSYTMKAVPPSLQAKQQQNPDYKPSPTDVLRLAIGTVAHENAKRAGIEKEYADLFQELNDYMKPSQELIEQMKQANAYPDPAKMRTLEAGIKQHYDDFLEKYQGKDDVQTKFAKYQAKLQKDLLTVEHKMYQVQQQIEKEGLNPINRSNLDILKSEMERINSNIVIAMAVQDNFKKTEQIIQKSLLNDEMNRNTERVKKNVKEVIKSNIKTIQKTEQKKKKEYEEKIASNKGNKEQDRISLTELEKKAQELKNNNNIIINNNIIDTGSSKNSKEKSNIITLNQLGKYNNQLNNNSIGTSSEKSQGSSNIINTHSKKKSNSKGSSGYSSSHKDQNLGKTKVAINQGNLRKKVPSGMGGL